MYAFNPHDSEPGYLFASESSDSGYGDSVMVYYDLESMNEVWNTMATGDFDGANSLDIAGDLFGDGSSVVVVAIEDTVYYYSTRYISI